MPKNSVKSFRELKFLDYVHTVYGFLQKSNLGKIGLSGSINFESFFTSAYPKFSIEVLRKKYREEITRVVNERLYFFKDSIQSMRALKEVNLYENSIAFYTIFFIFWILENELDMSVQDQEKLCDAIFAGTIGYRLLDLNQDHKLIGQEALMLGYFLINSYEELLLEIFHTDDTPNVVKKYAKLYSQVEYEEKRNRWKACPFTWDEVTKLGFKAAPIFSIFELLFTLKKFDKIKIQSLIEGIVCIVSTTQLCDDIVDAEEDLANGFETLVMSGYYNKYGTKDSSNDKKISDFLDEKRMQIFYETNIRLFNNAREIFTQHEEYLILIMMELNYAQFMDSFYSE